MATPGQVLASAFRDDPMFVFIQPDDGRRVRLLPWFFGAAARLGRLVGRVDVDADRGVAIWLEPGARLGPRVMVRSGLALAPVRLGLPAMRRFVRLTTAFERAGARVHGDRYWHLFILGVAPADQGRGVGSRIVAPVLARADAARERCYLETTEETNLPFYERLGFVVAERCEEQGLPTFWTMVREPRDAGDGLSR